MLGIKGVPQRLGLGSCSYKNIGQLVQFQRVIQVAKEAKTKLSSLQTGIVGLPNVGKSTLFNSMMKKIQAEAANFPFCTIEPNVGVVPVPDKRLQVLADLVQSRSVVPSSIEFVDIAGLVKGASEGEGLGNKFLANIRQTDAIIQVVRCFENDNVIHVNGRVDPVEDVETIDFELALADLQQIEKRVERLKKAKSKEDEKLYAVEKEALEKVKILLDQSIPARKAKLNDNEKQSIKHLQLLTMKPCIFCANCSEDDLQNQGKNNQHLQALRKKAVEDNSEVVIVSAQIEAELGLLEEQESIEFLQSLGLEESSLNTLIRTAYTQLKLRTYFTSGEQETRAWTIKEGFTAPQAAGVIHSDFQRGFIRAETINYDDVIKHGGMKQAQEQGLMRLEGKEYIVQEGDVLLFRFNV